jgi:pimeloyl-ACP methyl ester carboxylesterase
MIHTHQTAPTQFVEANGIRFAYRRFGKAGGVPLVFHMHYLGTMDYWDPTVTDGLARDREVILFNNAGVSSSSGEVPTTFEQMGANAIAFSRALGLTKADMLGFSIGGMIVQEITLQAPDLVRKLVLVGTGPRGGEGMESMTLVAQRIFGAAYDPPENMWLAVLFSPSEAAQVAGKEFLKRKHLRQEGCDPEVNDKVSPAQVEAMDKWGVQKNGSYDYLKTIKQPTLVVNGSNDLIMPTINSFIMEQNIPKTQLITGRSFNIPSCLCGTLRCSWTHDVHDVGLRRHTGRWIEGVSRVETLSFQRLAQFPPRANPDRREGPRHRTGARRPGREGTVFGCLSSHQSPRGCPDPRAR